MIDPLRTYELQSAASGLSLCCDAPGAQSAGSIAHGSMPGARRATVLFLDTGFGVTAGKSENNATSAATGAFGMGKPPARVGALHGAHWGRGAKFSVPPLAAGAQQVQSCGGGGGAEAAASVKKQAFSMLLAQCAVSLLSHGSDRQHGASSVLDAKGDDLRSSGRPDVAVTPNRTITLFTDGISHETGRIVYIIGGQSQASGKGLTNELTDDERDRAAALGRRVMVEYPKLDIEPEQLTELKDALKKDYMSNSAPQNDPRVGRTAKIASRIHDDPRIKPGSSTLGEIASGSQGGTFGPEVSFGLRMAEAMPFRNITVIKVSWPGVDMPTYVRALYPTVLSSLQRFGEAHGKFELGGMVWLHGEFDAGFNEPDFLSTRATVSLAPQTPAAQNPTALSPTMHVPMAAWQYPAAANYSNQLQSLVRNLRADTGVQVPFAAALMRIFHASWSKDHPPSNVRVVNNGIRAAASALEKMYVVDGYSRKLPRYFDEPQHCVPSDVQARMGSLWTNAFANLCRHPTSLKGSGCKNDARWDTAMGVSACLPQHDLHFTARGQIGVGRAFAERLLSDQGSKSSGAKGSPRALLVDEQLS